MKLYPERFRELFVAGDKELDGYNVKETLMYPNEMSNVEREIMEHMNEFLEGAEPSVLKKFLTFATGAPCLPEFGLDEIEIQFGDVESIFSSTCSRKLTLPRMFPDKKTFDSALQAVCDSCGKAFTSV